MDPEIIFRYFPGLSEMQTRQFRQLWPEYSEWNAKINVISRKDLDNLYERHVLHSLAIAKIIQFKPGTKIMDAGTGGGFPGIPLAIMFPGSHFHLVDSTAKKLNVVKAVASNIGLQNVTTEHCRFEDHRLKYDFVVSRAVGTLDMMASGLFKNVRPDPKSEVANGILYLKGGDIQEELDHIDHKYKVYMLNEYFTESFFETKKLVHLF